MKSFPNLPPPSTDDAVGSRPVAGAGTAVAGGPPEREALPAQEPLRYGSELDPSELATDEMFLDDLMKERYTLPVVVLVASVVATLAIFGTFGYRAAVASNVAGVGGVAGAVDGCVKVTIALAIACVVCSSAGWLIHKIFGDDYGSSGGLVLRFSAVATAQFPILLTMIYFLDLLPAMFFNFPVMMVMTIGVAGVDLLRAVIFNAVLAILNMLMVSYFLMALFAS